MTKICEYCRKSAVLVNGEKIYPHRTDLYKLNFWLCEDCGAYVGCHKGTITPLGRLANAELRKAKSAAHNSFDPKWRNRSMSRDQAYDWLSRKLGIDKKDCHIGMFDVDMCNKVIEVCRA